MRALPSYAVLAFVSFLLHLVWERSHIVLYTGYEALEGVLPVFVYATIGDVAYTLFAAFLFAVVYRDGEWMKTAAGREYAVLALLGLCIAILVEMKAMYLDRWEYTHAMPLLYGLGLSPLIQMTVLLPLSVLITVAIVRRLRI